MNFSKMKAKWTLMKTLNVRHGRFFFRIKDSCFWKKIEESFALCRDNRARKFVGTSFLPRNNLRTNRRVIMINTRVCTHSVERTKTAETEIHGRGHFHSDFLRCAFARCRVNAR